MVGHPTRQTLPEKRRGYRKKSTQTIRDVSQASQLVYPIEERWSDTIQDTQNAVIGIHETPHLVPSTGLRSPEIEHSHVILNDRQFLCGVPMEALILAYDCPAQPTHLGKPFVVIGVLGEKLVMEYNLDRNAHQPKGFGNPPPDVSVEKQRMGWPPTDHCRSLRPRNEGHPLKPCRASRSRTLKRLMTPQLPNDP